MTPQSSAPLSINAGARMSQDIVRTQGAEPIKCGLEASNDDLTPADVDEEVRRIEREAARGKA